VRSRDCGKQHQEREEWEVLENFTREEFFKLLPNGEQAQQRFESLEGNNVISWRTLTKIYVNYCKLYESEELTGILSSFCRDWREFRAIHSIASRIKEPFHLIEKVIRNLVKERNKYKEINENNFRQCITDIIGVRFLLVLRTEWEFVHSRLEEKFNNSSNEGNAFLENPIAYYCLGDDTSIYDMPIRKNVNNNIEKRSTARYRSVHYVLKYKNYPLELQVRTIFEEGWGEVDHRFYYPYFEKEESLRRYSEMLKTATGFSDMIASFMNACYKEIQEKQGVQPRGEHVQKGPTTNHMTIREILKSRYE
jgi:ppGpp synthetase/RelA/SpoT-type nucleotidyltranferase